MSGSEKSATVAAKTVVAQMDPGGKIASLEEWVRLRARMLVCGLALVGYGRARVICGHRSMVECWRLFGLGRTEETCLRAGVEKKYAQPGKTEVTWIWPQGNAHQRRRALDIDFTMYAELSIDMVARVARSVGMTYGGEWSVRDTYHFEI